MLLARPAGMQRDAPAPGDGARFDVSTQSGGSINNVGGNLYLGAARRRSAAIGRAAAALGLALVFAAFSVAGLIGVDIYRQTDGFTQSSFTVPGSWRPAVGLLAGGLVLNRFGPLLASP